MKRRIPYQIILFVSFFAVATVWVRLSIVRQSYEIDHVNKVIKNAQDEVQQLELEIAQLRSPSRLERIAKEKFKLGMPDAKQIVYIGR